MNRLRWLTVLITLSITLGLIVPIGLAQSGGTPWSVPENFSQQPDGYSEAPTVMCDQYQNAHVFWMERLDNNATSVLYYRNNVGGTWTPPLDVVIAGPMLGMSAVLTPDNTAHVIWQTAYRGDVYYTQAPLAEAADAKAWQPPSILASQVGGSNLFTDEHGGLYVVYDQPDENNTIHAFFLIQSTDGGQTWDEPTNIFTISAPVPAAIPGRIRVDGRGRFHFVYQIRSLQYGVYSFVGYRRSLDRGATWSTPLQLAAGNTSPGVDQIGVFTFGNDEVHLTWDQPERRHQWSYDGGETWSQPVTIMELGAAFGGLNVLAKDSAGTLHVISAVGDGVYHATWDGQNWNPPEAIDRRFIDPHNQSLAICEGNRLHVVYNDRTGETEVWYATKQVNAPRIAAQPLPQPTPEPTATAAPTVVPVVTATAESPLSPISLQQPRYDSGESALPIVLGALTVVALLIGVAGALFVRTRS
jgi:hypothetical protein